MVAAGYIELLVVAVVVLALVAYGGFYLLRVLRLRRLQAEKGEGSGPEVTADRAYNRLALARKEATLLEAQGGDVAHARELIDLASRSLDGRAFDQAYERAQAAHEALVQARAQLSPARNLSAAALPSSTPGGAPPHAGSPVPAAASAPPAAPTVPKNRAEAQFQLRLFEQDLVTAKRTAPKAPSTGEATQLYVQAHAAYDRAEYAEAFRLSLRGRRRVGGTVETLGTPGPSGVAASANEGSAPTDPVRMAEAVAAQERCPACGHPVVSGDSFCRGCGAARTSAACPKCGAPRKPADSFCGRCGGSYG